jgi:hypothetical protein
VQLPRYRPVIAFASAVLLTGCAATVPSTDEAVYLCEGYLVSESRLAEVGAASCTRVVHHSDAPACGGRVAVQDVAVIDPAEAPRGDGWPTAADWDGPDWVAVEGAGSGVGNQREVVKIAASLGCDLVLLGPHIPADRTGRGLSRYSFNSHQLVKLMRQSDQPIER